VTVLDSSGDGDATVVLLDSSGDGDSEQCLQCKAVVVMVIVSNGYSI
jgi:hypothetical protein